jgi:hypothetical protein
VLFIAEDKTLPPTVCGSSDIDDRVRLRGALVEYLWNTQCLAGENPVVPPKKARSINYNYRYLDLLPDLRCGQPLATCELII